MRDMIKKTVGIFFIIFMIFALTLMILKKIPQTAFWISAAISAIVGFALNKIK